MLLLIHLLSSSLSSPNLGLPAQGSHTITDDGRVEGSLSDGAMLRAGGRWDVRALRCEEAAHDGRPHLGLQRLPESLARALLAAGGAAPEAEGDGADARLERRLQPHQALGGREGAPLLDLAPVLQVHHLGRRGGRPPRHGAMRDDAAPSNDELLLHSVAGHPPAAGGAGGGQGRVPDRAVGHGDRPREPAHRRDPGGERSGGAGGVCRGPQGRVLPARRDRQLLQPLCVPTPRSSPFCEPCRATSCGADE